MKDSDFTFDGDDDDEDFVNAVGNLETSYKSKSRLSLGKGKKRSEGMRIRQSSSGYDDIDAIFGKTPSPHSAKKSNRAEKENNPWLISEGVSSSVNRKLELPRFNLEDPDSDPDIPVSFGSSSNILKESDPDQDEEDDDDDVPLLTQAGRDDDKVSFDFDDDDDMINLSMDIDEYKAPLENLEHDFLTQRVAADNAGYSDSDEECLDEAPVDDFMDDNDNEHRQLDVDDEDSKDSEVIGPSPVKQPSNRTSGRFSVSGDQNIKIQTPDPDDEGVDTPELDVVLQTAIEMKQRLFKNRNFHKAVTKLSQSEAIYLKTELAELSILVVEIFSHLPMNSLATLKSEKCKNLLTVQDCLQRLQKKLKEYENLHIKDITLTKTENELKNFHDSPPFDDSPDLDETSHNLQSSNVSLPAPTSNSTILSNAEPKKFVFKKPGASLQTTQPLPPGSRSTSSSFDPAPNYGQSTANNVTGTASTSSGDSGYEGYSGVESWAETSRASVRTCAGPVSGSSHGTQLIEDFHTQHQETVEEEVNYTSVLYNTDKCDDINTEGKFIGAARNDGKCRELSREDYDFSGAVRRMVGDTFGLKEFRPNQLQAVNSVLLGHDTFVLSMPHVTLVSCDISCSPCSADWRGQVPVLPAAGGGAGGGRGHRGRVAAGQPHPGEQVAGSRQPVSGCNLRTK